MREVNKLFVIPSFIGVIGGFSAILVRIVIDYSHKLANGINYFPSNRYFYLFSIPTVFLISSILINRFITDTSNPTIDSVAKSIALKKGRLDYKKGLASVILTAANIGFGTPVGREGPIAKFGGSFTSLFLKIFKIEGASIPLFVTCGVSSALAATFNAPIAAVVFGLEIILGRLNFSVIIPLATSSAIATIISRYFLGNYPTFYVHKLSYNHIFLLALPLFSLAFAAIIIFFTTIQKSFTKFYKHMSYSFHTKAIIGGIAVGILMFLFPHAASLGYKQVSGLFAHHYSFEDSFILSVIKTAALAITFASGIFGGIFAPSIFIGAFLGFSIGGLAGHFMSIDPLSVAIIGTAAVTAGMSNAPFRSSLIIIELTQNYQMAIPILLSSVITLYFVHILEERLHFSRTILQKGFDITDLSYRRKLEELNITNFIDTDLPVLKEDMKIHEIIFELMSSSSSYFPVVDKDKIIGVLSFRDVRLMYSKKDRLNTRVGELMTKNPSVLTIDANGMDVFEFISHIDTTHIPVVNNKKDKIYEGMLNVNSFNKFVSFLYLKKDNDCLIADRNP